MCLPGRFIGGGMSFEPLLLDLPGFMIAPEPSARPRRDVPVVEIELGRAKSGQARVNHTHMRSFTCRWRLASLPRR
jgi:hypothetical protein